VRSKIARLMPPLSGRSVIPLLVHFFCLILLLPRISHPVSEPAQQVLTDVGTTLKLSLGAALREDIEDMANREKLIQFFRNLSPVVWQVRAEALHLAQWDALRFTQRLG
jgi:hypothetical protein